MTYERAAEILDPEHRETYESLEIVNEACRMGRAALFRRMPEPPHPDGDESILPARPAGAANISTTRTGTAAASAAGADRPSTGTRRRSRRQAR